jgi:uncharacterized protein (DUF427 family)
VKAGLLWPSATRTICPYRGEAWHWTLRLGEQELEDAAWSYETPLPEAFAIRGHLCFYDSNVSMEVAEPSERYSL